MSTTTRTSFLLFQPLGQAPSVEQVIAGRTGSRLGQFEIFQANGTLVGVSLFNKYNHLLDIS